METETCNGWTNKETWAVFNNWSSYESDYEMMRETGSRLSLTDFADFMRDEADQILQRVLDGEANEASKNFIVDVGSLERVNWEEVAGAFKAETEDVSA